MFVPLKQKKATLERRHTFLTVLFDDEARIIEVFISLPLSRTKELLLVSFLSLFILRLPLYQRRTCRIIKIDSQASKHVLHFFPKVRKN